MKVYVRPAGSYIMDQLELRRVALYPETNVSKGDTVILVGNFTISAGLRAAEAFLVKHQVNYSLPFNPHGTFHSCNTANEAPYFV